MPYFGHLEQDIVKWNKKIDEDGMNQSELQAYGRISYLKAYHNVVNHNSNLSYEEVQNTILVGTTVEDAKSCADKKTNGIVYFMGVREASAVLSKDWRGKVEFTISFYDELNAEMKMNKSKEPSWNKVYSCAMQRHDPNSIYSIENCIVGIDLKDAMDYEKAVVLNGSTSYAEPRQVITWTENQSKMHVVFTPEFLNHLEFERSQHMPKYPARNESVKCHDDVHYVIRTDHPRHRDATLEGCGVNIYTSPVMCQCVAQTQASLRTAGARLEKDLKEYRWMDNCIPEVHLAMAQARYDMKAKKEVALSSHISGCGTEIAQPCNCVSPKNLHQGDDGKIYFGRSMGKSTTMAAKCLNSLTTVDGDYFPDYKHVPFEAVGTRKVTYKDGGPMLPRRIELQDEEKSDKQKELEFFASDCRRKK